MTARSEAAHGAAAMQLPSSPQAQGSGTNDIDFHALAAWPGCGLIECCDAAGIDGRLFAPASAAI